MLRRRSRKHVSRRREGVVGVENKRDGKLYVAMVDGTYHDSHNRQQASTRNALFLFGIQCSLILM